MTGISGPDTLGFGYDGLGRRRSLTVNGRTTVTLYDGWNPIQLQEHGVAVENRLMGLRLDALYARVRDGQVETYLTDALGSVLELRDAAQVPTVSYAYDPYGGTQASGTSSNTVKYTGREEDLGDLYYYRHRYYKPSIGRFLSEDPIGLAGGENLYGYVGGDPINYYDPLGLTEFPDDFVGPLPPDGYYTSEMTQTECGKVPPAPPGADINKNMEQAKKSWNPKWFYNQVRNKGPWDYKQHGRKYEDFGNFNFGATGSAFGSPASVLRRGTGWANQKADTKRTGLGSPFGGYPYGDDPKDQEQISKGIKYCECMGY